MRLCVLGATGKTGQQIVSQALAQGHDVTVLARDPSKLASKHERLRVIEGPIEKADIAIASQDAVISALGKGMSLKSEGIIAHSTPIIVNAMKKHGVRRWIVTSAFGVGPATRSQLPLGPRLFVHTLLRDIYRDKAAGEAILKQSDLDWTLVCPSGLTDGPLTGNYRKGERLPLSGLPKISRADAAHFILTQLTDRTYLRKEVLVTY